MNATAAGMQTREQPETAHPEIALFHRPDQSPPGNSSRGTGLALPQGWLLGAVLVLIYRVMAMFIPPADWTDGEWLHNRWAFVRLWSLAIAMVSMQALLHFLDKAATS
jgi:hypothetical protein